MKMPDFNKDHVKNIANQMKKNTDPEVLKVLVKQHTKQIQEIANSIAKEQAAITAKILPMLQLPQPTPGSILGWVNKTVTGFSMPQLEAKIGLVKQLSEVADAVSDITDAIAEVQKYIKEAQDLIDDVRKELDEVIGEALGAVNDIMSEVNGAIGDALGAIGEVQDLVNAVTGGVAAFDVSSPEAFLSSVDSTLDIFRADAEAVLTAVAPEVSTDVSSLPTLSGSPVVGQSLTCSSGTWGGTGPFTYRYQWYRGEEPLPGANSSMLTLTPNEYNRLVKCLVVATNKAGETESLSDVFGPIQDMPRITQPPQLSSPVAKTTVAISTSNGEWSGTSPITFQYQWLSNDVEIAGANSSSFTPNSTFINTTLKCTVIATNPIGTANSTSQPSFVIS